MATPIFQLRKPTATTETLILLVYRFGANKLVYSTGESIHPEHWNNETQRAKTDFKKDNPLHEITKSINIQLDRYFLKINEILGLWKLQKTEPTIEALKTELDKEFKIMPEPLQEPSPEKITLFGFIENYIKTVKFTRTSPPKPINIRTLQKYQTTLTTLKDFSQRKRNGKLDFENIDLEFYQDFVTFLQTPLKVDKIVKYGHTQNTVGKYIKTLKVFLKEATEAGINTNRAFESKKFSAMSENVEHINLTENELDLLWNYDLSNNKRLEAVRDLFLISCYTGLRFQDFTTLTPENIIEGTKLKIFTRKTGKPVVIPIHWRVAELLAKYENHLPRAISNQKMNDYLKELGELAGINGNIETVKTKGGLRVSQIQKKHELITCHTGRRTFATNLFRAGVPAISIMKFTGHQTEAVFMKYINVSDDENAELLLNHDFFTKGKMRAI